MLIVINDTKDLTTFYATCCRRAVHGERNQAVIATHHIEVHSHPTYGPQLEINVCDSTCLSMIDIMWDPRKGAWPLYFTSPNQHLGTCNLGTLTACWRTILHRHGVIDDTGILIKRDVA